MKNKKELWFSKKWAREKENTVVCECGMRTYMYSTDRTICRGCGHWVYKNKKTQLKYEMKKMGVLKCV